LYKKEQRNNCMSDPIQINLFDIEQLQQSAGKKIRVLTSGHFVRKLKLSTSLNPDNVVLSGASIPPQLE
jgi:hypothetical protein